jgi:hypothetical protein
MVIVGMVPPIDEGDVTMGGRTPDRRRDVSEVLDSIYDAREVLGPERKWCTWEGLRSSPHRASTARAGIPRWIPRPSSRCADGEGDSESGGEALCGREAGVGALGAAKKSPGGARCGCRWH